MTADATLIPDTAQIAFTIANGHEQVIDWSDILAILDARVAAAELADASVGLTADVSSIQGGGVITTQYNVYDTVAVAGDAATLPAVSTVGQLVYVKNDAAVNAMDVFPARGDDLGAGANTALSVLVSTGVVFICTVANATWTQLLPPS